MGESPGGRCERGKGGNSWRQRMYFMKMDQNVAVVSDGKAEIQ